MVPSAEPNANRKDIPCHGSPPFPEEVPTQEEVDALTAIASAMGGISQLGRVIARSLALTRALLAFEKELARGRFSRAFAEQVDIAVANENGCPVGVLAAGMLVAVVGYVLPLRLWMPDLHESRRLQLKITAVPVAVLIVVQALSVARSPFVR